MNKTITTVAALSVMLISESVAAHPIHNELATFSGGIVHPFTNWIHVLSTIAIGFWLGHRSGNLIAMILLGGIIVGTLFLLNVSLHIIAMTSFTWPFLAGFFISTILLLVTGVLVSASIKTATLPTISVTESPQDQS